MIVTDSDDELSDDEDLEPEDIEEIVKAKMKDKYYRRKEEETKHYFNCQNT